MKFTWLKYLSTKFLLAVGALFGGFYLVLTEHDIGEFVALVATVLGFYNGANVAQDYFYNKKEVALNKAEIMQQSPLSPNPQVVINTTPNPEEGKF